MYIFKVLKSRIGQGVIECSILMMKKSVGYNCCRVSTACPPLVCWCQCAGAANWGPEVEEHQGCTDNVVRPQLRGHAADSDVASRGNRALVTRWCKGSMWAGSLWMRWLSTWDYVIARDARLCFRKVARCCEWYLKGWHLFSCSVHCERYFKLFVLVCVCAATATVQQLQTVDHPICLSFT